MSFFPGQLRPISIEEISINTSLWSNLSAIRVTAPIEDLETANCAFIFQNTFLNQYLAPELDSWVFEYVNPSCANEYWRLKSMEKDFSGSNPTLGKRILFREHLLKNPATTPFPALLKAAEVLSNAQDNGSYVPSIISIRNKGNGKYRVANMLQWDKKLGRGHSADVYRVPGYTLDGKTGQIKDKPHVVKVLKKDPSLEGRIQNEVRGNQLFAYLRDEFQKIYGLKLFGVVEPARLHRLPDGTACLVMKLYDGNDLHNLVYKSDVPPTLDFTAKLFLGPMEALAFFAENGVAYFDIKPENLFISRTKMATGDASSAFTLPELDENETFHTLLQKLSPEILRFPDFTARFITKEEYTSYKASLDELRAFLRDKQKTGNEKFISTPLTPEFIDFYNKLRKKGEKIQVMQMGIALLSAYLWVIARKSYKDYIIYEEDQSVEPSRKYFLKAKKNLTEVFKEEKMVQDFGEKGAKKLGSLVARMMKPSDARPNAKKAFETYRTIIF